ncbi:Phosphatidylinositol 3-phosphate 5-kinase, partial [Globisporangium splendens]
MMICDALKNISAACVTSQDDADSYWLTTNGTETKRIRAAATANGKSEIGSNTSTETNGVVASNGAGARRDSSSSGGSAFEDRLVVARAPISRYDSRLDGRPAGPGSLVSTRLSRFTHSVVRIKTLQIPRLSPGESVGTMFSSLDAVLGVQLALSSHRDYKACANFVLPGSDAEVLGIQPDAVVVSLNGRSLKWYTFDQVEEAIRGALMTSTMKKWSDSAEDAIDVPEIGDYIVLEFSQCVQEMKVDKNPYEMTRFPSPLGQQLPGVKNFQDVEAVEPAPEQAQPPVPVQRHRERPKHSLKHFWMSDRSCKTCYECEQMFTFVRRRHHCRSCGQIFCAQCCARLPQSFGGPKVDESITRLRKQLVCHTCHRRLREGMQMELAGVHAQNNKSSGSQNSPVSQQTLMLMPPQLAEKLERSNSDVSHYKQLDKGELFDKDDISDDIKANEQPEKARSSALFSMFPKVQIVSSVQHLAHQTRLHGMAKDNKRKDRIKQRRLRTFSEPLAVYGRSNLQKDKDLRKLKRSNTLSGIGNPNDHRWSEAKSNQFIEKSNAEALSAGVSSPGSKIVTARPKALSGTFEETRFGSFVRINPFTAPPRSNEVVRPKSGSVSSYMDSGRLSVKETGMLGVIGLAENAGDDSGDATWVMRKDESMQTMADQGRARVEEQMFHQFKNSKILAKLSMWDQIKWMQIVSKFAHRAALSVTCEPDSGDSMDIMEYVKIKCLDGGRFQDSFYIDGVLVHKSLARKNMRTDIRDPRILLIASALDFQRNKEAISSLESVAGQEVEYMHIATEKIMTLHPDIVMFSGHVHRVAEELLFKENVAVVKNARLVDLQRIARCTGASLLTSYDHVDKISDEGVIGTCKRFYVMVSDQEPKSAKRFELKKGVNGAYQAQQDADRVQGRKKRHQRQNIVFEGGIASKGCTLCLRGGSQEEFDEVTAILSSTVRAAYNMRLQRTLLVEYGYLPPPETLSETQNRSLAEEWFAKCSSSLYLSLKSNSLSMRAALRETQSMCKWCKDHTRFNNISSLRGTWENGDADAHHRTSMVNLVPRLSHTDACTCGSKSSEGLRDRILFSTCWSALGGKTASKAEMMCIDFYSSNDCSLGQFLEKYCFSESADEFKRVFTTSKLSFANDTVRVTLRVKDLGDIKDQSDRMTRLSELLRDISYRVPRQLVRSNQVLMWSRSLDPSWPTLSAQYTTVPHDVWNYSFGKFLEDMFYGKSLSIDAIRFPHLSQVNGSRDASLVHYFCRRGRIVSVQCEPVEPVLHVALQPALWKDHIDYDQQSASVKELCELAREVYDVTTSKVAESMADLVTPFISKHNLKTMRNEVELWYSCFASKLQSDPPQDVFAENAHFKEIYTHAAGWSLRITQAMHSTVKPSIKHTVNSPKSALPRAWFDQLAQAGATDGSFINFSTDSTTSPGEDTVTDVAGNLESLAKFARSLASGEKMPPQLNIVTNEVANTLNTQRHLELSDLWNTDEKDDSTSHSFPANESSDSGSYANNFSAASTVGSISSRKALDTFRRNHQTKKIEGLGYLTIPKKILAWHPSLPTCVKDTTVLVNATQPTSVVAYSLCSNLYTKKVNRYIRKEAINLDAPVNAVELETKANLASQAAMVRMLRSATRNNVDHVFVDENQFQPATRFSCKSYYAMQFHALRRLYYGGDRNYVESLCHCEQWNAAGGKSGADFLKTRDQRFIAKAIPEIELQMFLSMANEYFSYMAKTFENNLSSMLSKVLGVYKVSISNASQGESDIKMCIIVMENLIYGRDVDFSFDLKGKMEGRYKEHNGKVSKPVLWDRNFVEMAGGIPLPLQESALSLLLSAIVNDTAFLSSVQATDYSMLIGYDVKKQEVVASIIDYIHKYDFMKMVEHAGKRLIQEEGEITVLNPKHYRKRFCQAMTKYFMTIPSRYTKVTTVTRNLTAIKEEEENENSPPVSAARRISAVNRQSVCAAEAFEMATPNEE